MSHRVCPWWLGYVLLSPLRRIGQNPERILGPYVREGMTVLEPGPGMGYFTIALARMVGPSGRVVVVDVQAKMLDTLKRRLAKRRLLERVDTRLAPPDSMGVGDLRGRVDVVIAFSMVHEMPSPAAFFHESAQAMKPGALLLLAEPTGHVDAAYFQQELDAATAAGFTIVERPEVKRSQTALLKRI